MAQFLSLPQLKQASLLKECVLILGASMLISLAAPFALPLPGTPVPIAITLQLIFVLAVLLGSKRIFFSIVLFLAQGAMGLPVFAKGNAGVAYIMGPMGGYLLGYLVSAFLVGYLAEQLKTRSSSKLFGIMALGNGLVFLLGALHLSLFVGLEHALAMGVIPFIPGDLLKIGIAIACLHKTAPT